MTAQEAIDILHRRKYKAMEINGKETFIFPLIESEMEKVTEFITQQQAQIERQGRMIERLIDELIEDIGECPPVKARANHSDSKSDAESNEICCACWRKWLEEETK